MITKMCIRDSYNSARMAAEAMREKYPERKIYVVDSKNASSGFGLLVEKAKELQESGMDIDTCLLYTSRCV